LHFAIGQCLQEDNRAFLAGRDERRHGDHLLVAVSHACSWNRSRNREGRDFLQGVAVAFEGALDVGGPTRRRRSMTSSRATAPVRLKEGRPALMIRQAFADQR